MSACQSLTGTVGDNSCQGVSACGLPTVKNQLIIGDVSCVGDQSCFQVKSCTKRRNREKDTVIGDGSCDAPNACSNFQGVSIGSNSCNCEGCCSCFATGELPDEIPSDSCDVKGECCATSAPTGVPSSGPTEAASTVHPTLITDSPRGVPSSGPTEASSTVHPTLIIEGLADCKKAGSASDIVNCLSSPDLLADPNSPQSQALQWIQGSSEVENWDGLELSQRYVVGLFWASSQSGCWYSSTGGLQSFGNQDTPICGVPDLVSCNADNEIIYIDFSHLGITGTLPRELGALTVLEYLNVSWNCVTGQILPSEIGLLTQLTRLELDYNQLTGAIPSKIGQLTALTRLDLRTNQLTGAIPTQLGQLTALGFFFVQANQLTGTIPTQLGQLTNFRELYLSFNPLIGGIPSELAQLAQLIDLGLVDNQLTGTIPLALAQLINLKRVYLDRNNLTGAVPSGFCDAPFPDWRNTAYDLVADCMAEVQCDCCNACYDASDKRFEWNGNGFR